MNPQANSIRLLCPEIIGRTQELDMLEKALSRTTTGQPQFVWLAGEAGLGKTALCHAFIERSQDQQAVILYGRTISQESVLPFSPFLDLFLNYFPLSARIRTPFDQALQSTFAFLWQFLPDLPLLFPEIIPPVVDIVSAPVQRQQMLFYSIFRGLHTLTQTCAGPLVIILEDLHWADETSLELLEFLAQHFTIHTSHIPNSPLPLLILGTYRTEALPENVILQRTVSRLHTLRCVHTISLAPLDATEHQHCVSSILHQPAPPEFAESLFRWDEGNPFFLEELLGAMVAGGQLQAHPEGWRFPSEKKPSLPPSLSAAILERFRQLPLTDQEVLKYAAVVGRSFDFSFLAVLCGMNERELIWMLQRAVAIQLIDEIPGLRPEARGEAVQERYQFRHALTREAIYEGMLQSERRLLHRTVAETVEKLLLDQAAEPSAMLYCPDNAAQLLVEQYPLAGLAGRAYPYALQEAHNADQICAFREECYYLDLAQASLPTNAPERFHLLERLGMVRMGIYDFPAALYWLSQAEKGYRQSGHISQAVQVLAYMLLPAWFLASHEMPRMVVEVETDLEDAFTHPDATKRDVNILVAASILSMYQVTQCQHRRMIQWVQRCITVFDMLVDPRKEEAIQISYIARSWAQAHLSGEDIEGCIAGLRDVFMVARQQRLSNALMFGYLAIIMILVFWGRMDEVEQWVSEAMEDETRYGTLRIAYIIGWKHFYAGIHWAQGMDFLRDKIEHRKRNNIPAALSIEGMILAHFLIARHELTEAGEYLREAQPIIEQMNESWFVIWMRWGLAKFHLAQGDTLQAQEWYERTLACWKFTEDRLYILTILLDGVACYAHTGNLIQAELWLAELQSVTQMTHNPVGSAGLLEAQSIVAAAKGKLHQAIDLLRKAVEAWQKLQFYYQYALAAHRLAGMLLQWTEHQTVNRKERQQIREEARVLLNQAFKVYEDLGILTGKEAVQSLLAKTHLAAQQKRRETVGAGKNLTKREIQVLRLLATGQSNKEIAQELRISIGTVERHIVHIFYKLHCKTRTQAATYAVAQGLIKVTPPSQRSIL